MKSLIFLGMVVCVLLSGCDDSKNPLSDPQASRPDDRLTGVWRSRDNETVYLVDHAGEGFLESMLRIVEITHSQGKLMPPEEYLAFPTVIGGKTYLNLIWEKKTVQQLDEQGWKPDVVTSYAFLRYQFDGDKLVVYIIDEEAKSRAVKGGKIKGAQDRDGIVQFTDSAENVARFVTAAGDSLWNMTDTERLERVSFAKQP